MSEEYISNEDRVSYGIGRQMGEQLLTNSFLGLNNAAVIAGLDDALHGRPCPVADEDMDKAFHAIGEIMKAEQEASSSNIASEGAEFLVENAKRKDITVTESGLQYEVITTGDGATPVASSVVRTHYEGSLMDGSIFDSSYKRGEPAEFPVGGVIAGWTEALQKMTVGSKWRLYIPSNLAYGEQGAGNAIGPNATLIFDIELLDIVS